MLGRFIQQASAYLHNNMQELEQRIVDAALLEFSRKGYDGSTTKGIAKRARVNEVTLFRKFGSKEKILALSIKASREEALATLESVLAETTSCEDLKECLLKIHSNLLSFLESRSDLILLQIWEGRKRKDMREQIMSIPSSMTARLAEIFEEQIRVGKMKKADPRQLATIFFGHLFHQAMLRKFVDGGSGQSSMQVKPETFIEVFLDGAASN
jgi:TetR/AcrR family transcriptional regulator